MRFKSQQALLPTSTRRGNPSVISADCHILGNAMTEGALDIDGSIQGNVKAYSMTLRPNGRIEGDIIAEIVHIHGHVRGMIRAKQIHLFSTAHVEGILLHETLTIADGAYFDGKSSRTDKINLLESEKNEVQAGRQILQDMGFVS